MRVSLELYAEGDGVQCIGYVYVNAKLIKNAW